MHGRSHSSLETTGIPNVSVPKQLALDSHHQASTKPVKRHFTNVFSIRDNSKFRNIYLVAMLAYYLYRSRNTQSLWWQSYRQKVLLRRQIVHLLPKTKVAVKTVLKVIGTMAATITLVPLARKHMRILQWLFFSQWSFRATSHVSPDQDYGVMQERSKMVVPFQSCHVRAILYPTTWQLWPQTPPR